jgi:hypothetical protein
MKEQTEIPRAITLEIALCSSSAHRTFVRRMLARRRKVTRQLRALGMSDREIGNLLGVTPQCVWQQCPRKPAAVTP